MENPLFEDGRNNSKKVKNNGNSLVTKVLTEIFWILYRRYDLNGNIFLVDEKRNPISGLDLNGWAMRENGMAIMINKIKFLSFFSPPLLNSWLRFASPRYIHRNVHKYPSLLRCFAIKSQHDECISSQMNIRDTVT